MKEEWSESAGPFRFEFNAPHGLNDRSSFEVSIILVTKTKTEKLAMVIFGIEKNIFLTKGWAGALIPLWCLV